MISYEEIIQEDPVIQKLLAEREIAGKADGEIQGIRDSILVILSIRFSPALATKAQSMIMSMQNCKILKRLQRQLLKAADEEAALLVLDLPEDV